MQATTPHKSGYNLLPMMLLAIALVAVIGGVVWSGSAGPGLLESLGLKSSKVPGEGVYITEKVISGPFLVSLNVQGFLDSQKNATLSCEVEGTTTIISLVPEGTMVNGPVAARFEDLDTNDDQVLSLEEFKADSKIMRPDEFFKQLDVDVDGKLTAEEAKLGELVCELDSSQFKEKAKQQEIKVTQAEAALIQAQEALEIQRNQNASDIAAAELKWKLAKLDLVKYEEGEYPQQTKQLQGTVILNKEELVRAEENLTFIREQVKKGYRNQNDLESARLSVQQSELKLQGSEEEVKVLTNFTYQRTIEELKANAAELERELARVKLKAASALAQFGKDVEALELTATVERETYVRLLKQIQVCALRATQDGEVVYANLGDNRRGGEATNIQEGATVRERQAIINLPDVTKMKVGCRIHESSIGAVRKGLPARIRIDAYPEEYFNGEIFSVSSVPMTGSWPNTDLREYATEIRLTDDVEKIRKLRPGLTTQVEILVDNRKDVLQVPVQAVVGVSNIQIAYVLKGKEQTERREIKIGQSSQTHIEVKDGLAVGDVVILNPRSRFTEEIGKLEAELNAQREKDNPTANIPPPAAADAARPPVASGPGGGGPGGGGGGGAPDPAAFFARLDANSDGKLTSDELSGPMQSRFADLDSDGNKEVTVEEFKQNVAKLRPPGGGGGGPGAGGPRGGPPGGGGP